MTKRCSRNLFKKKRKNRTLEYFFSQNILFNSARRRWQTSNQSGGSEGTLQRGTSPEDEWRTCELRVRPRFVSSAKTASQSCILTRNPVYHRSNQRLPPAESFSKNHGLSHQSDAKISRESGSLHHCTETVHSTRLLLLPARQEPDESPLQYRRKTLPLTCGPLNHGARKSVAPSPSAVLQRNRFRALHPVFGCNS